MSVAHDSSPALWSYAFQSTQEMGSGNKAIIAILMTHSMIAAADAERLKSMPSRASALSDTFHNICSVSTALCEYRIFRIDF